jgi:hypothetical protein
MAYERKTFDIIISEEFRTVLSEIEADSMVAKLLLKKRHDKESLVDDPINFISIAHDRTKISYLTTDRIEKLGEGEYWSSSRRFATRPGAFVGKIFKDIPSREVEKFANLYRSYANKVNSKFEVVDGDKILKYYHIDSYAEERGTLGASCMKYDSCQRFLGIYTDNPDLVKLLVLLNDNGGLLGRALLWNVGGRKIMDRIYTTADEDFVYPFKKWATENGYLYKSEQNWYNSLFFENLTTTKKEIRIDFKLNNFEFSRYPYVDTFKFLNTETGVLSNYIPEGYFNTLCSSDGSKYGSDYLVFDNIDRVLRHRGDSAYVHYLNFYTHHNNVRYSEINDQYILNEDCFYDEELGEYLYNEKYNQFNNVDRIKERRDYLLKRRESLSKKKSKSSSSWLESIINTTYGGDMEPNVEDIVHRLYDDLVSESGIPSGYFYDRFINRINEGTQLGESPTDEESNEPVTSE